MQPNLFCLGFPKSATTSVAEWLDYSDHVFVPSIKEPGFHIKDDPNTAVKGIEKYKSLYANTNKARYSADFTTTYIYEKGVLNNLALQDDVKFFGLLRNPNKAAPSMFHFNNRLGGEVDSFETALRDEDARKRGRQLPEVARLSGMPLIRVCYKQQFHYDIWLKKLSENVLSRSFIVTMEGFLNSDDLRKEFCEFLGIPYIENELPRLNRFEAPAASSLKRFIAYPPWPLSQIKNYIKTQFDISDTDLMRRFYSSKGMVKEKPPSDLCGIYDIELLKAELEKIDVKGLNYWERPIAN